MRGSSLGHFIQRAVFLKRYSICFDQSEEEVLDAWRRKFLAYRESTLLFFKDDEQFCHFTLGEDRIEKLVSFLARDYRLSGGLFQQFNSGHGR